MSNHSPRHIASYEIFPAPRGGGYIVALFDQHDELIQYTDRHYESERAAKEYGESIVASFRRLPDSQEDENVCVGLKWRAPSL